MDIDLFNADLDNITFSDIELFTGILRPKNERPPEGIRLDYKADMPDDLGKIVIAFANTYGGIIILGVEEAEYSPNGKKQKQNVPVAIPGIKKGGDIKSRITNMIVTTVYPRPHFSISRPLDILNQQDIAVVVIRVEESRITPHMFIKANRNEIMTRINDNNFPAPLHEIENLFERRKSQGHPMSESIFQHFREDLFISSILDDKSTTSRMNQHHRMYFIPFDTLYIRLDRNYERFFEKQIKTSFNTSNLNIHSRHAEYYEIGICDYTPGKFINVKWRLYSNGSMGFISEFGGGSPRRERLGKLIYDALCAFKVYKEILGEDEYFGQSYLHHELSSVKETKLLPEMLEPVSNMYDPMEGVKLGKDTISSTIHPHEHKTSRTLDFSDIERPEETIAEIFLEHLRALFDGNIDYNKLLEHVRSLNS